VAGDATPGFDVVYVGLLLGHGGDALQMLTLADGVRRRGARVQVIVPATPQSVSFAERCADLGIACVRTGLLSVDVSGSHTPLRSVVRLLRSVDAPIVHFHTGDTCLPRRVLVALEVVRFRRAFVTIQSPYETIVPGTARARSWAWSARRRLHAIVCPSDHARAFQIRCGVPAALAVTVRNSIDVEAMASGDADVARRALGVDRSTPVVMFTSRIDGQKRPVDAVQAFAAVAEEFPTAVLVFVGTGDQEDAVAAEAARLGVQDRVRLMGYRTNIADWLAAASVWILPTERENFSVAVLEALAAGRAVLATSCPGNDEVLADGSNALTFAVGDVGAATAGLRELLSNDARRRELGEQAKASAQQFTAARMVEQYCELYRRHTGIPAPQG
jgi:glycosyltransferase involved in cell wall biosynthesis